jgi:phage shock protein C
MRRSATDKMMAGVCGGIAEHTDIDPVYIRLAFLVSLFWGGIGLFAYIAAAVLMPRPVPPGP